MRLQIQKHPKIVCLLLLLATAACSSSGYYDANGQYHAYGENDTHRNDHAMASAPASSGTTTTNTPANSVYVPEGNVSYYDQEHPYEGGVNVVHIPRECFPPSGMCRVWFPDKPASAQPPAESCQGIQDRAPANSYVIYGK